MGKGFNLAMKIVKEIDKAGKRAARETEKQQKANERDRIRNIKDRVRSLERQVTENEREIQRQEKADEREQVKKEKEEFLQLLEYEKLIFDDRVLKRTNMRIDVVTRNLK